MFSNVKTMRHRFFPVNRFGGTAFTVFLLSLFFIVSPCTAQIENAGQLVFVVTPDWNSTTGLMYLFNRTDGGWLQYNIPWKVVLADSGLAWGIGLHTIPPGERKKVEGDHRSPAGVFELGDFFGYDSAPPPGIRFPYQHATKVLHCVDDTGSVFYNSLVSENEVKRDSMGRLPWKSSEVMKMDSACYKYGIVVKHNPHSIPGKGSCIFLHIIGSDSSTTSGCTAMGEGNLLFLMQWLDPEEHPLLVQLPAFAFRKYLLEWNLPLLLKN
jgi:L,D-peptidoglycan transpeptidase YkuD (ErfK/YbiS/YcfS/YnhG family)